MTATRVVSLFNELSFQYPRAAAGLLDDLCMELGRLLQKASEDQASIDQLVDTIGQCFRPMDAAWPPDSYPWDAAYYCFGRWLWRSDDSYSGAVVSITGWPADRIEKCKADYRRAVLCNRDEWLKAAELFEPGDPSRGTS